MTTYTVDLFSTLDGFGSGRVAYWGKDGPELREQRAHHGSLAMNRALLAAGLVDRLEVMVFPVITGATGADPIFAKLPDIDLELVDSQVFDGRVQQLSYLTRTPNSPVTGLSSVSPATSG